MREKQINHRTTRHSAMSEMMAQYVDGFSPESEKVLTTTVADFCNSFIEDFQEIIEDENSTPQVWGRHATICVEEPNKHQYLMFVKVLISLQITLDDVHIYSFIVHPEEADILLQCSLGDRYDDVYSEV